MRRFCTIIAALAKILITNRKATMAIFYRLFLLFLCWQVLGSSAQAQSEIDGRDIVGRWKTIDDNTGKIKSIVRIYQENGKYFGKIEQIFREPHENQDPVCEPCTDYRKNQRVIGLVVIRNMVKYSSKYADGDILDPEKGEIYSCTIWLEGTHVLKVRGWWGMFYRTQTWIRTE